MVLRVGSPCRFSVSPQESNPAVRLCLLLPLVLRLLAWPSSCIGPDRCRLPQVLLVCFNRSFAWCQGVRCPPMLSRPASCRVMQFHTLPGVGLLVLSPVLFCFLFFILPLSFLYSLLAPWRIWGRNTLFQGRHTDLFLCEESITCAFNIIVIVGFV